MGSTRQKKKIIWRQWISTKFAAKEILSKIKLEERMGVLWKMDICSGLKARNQFRNISKV